MSLRLDYATFESAKYAIEHWHYSKTMPSGKLYRIGVWEHGKFIGVICFGMGAQINLVRQYGLTPFAGCELVRIALRKHQTPVTRMVKIALSMLKRDNPKLRLVVSFADPNAGHTGQIYKAGNWIAYGRSPDARFPIIGGKLIHPRTFSEMVKSGKIPSRKSVPRTIVKGKYRFLYPLDDEIRQRILTMRQSFNGRTTAFHAANGGSTPTLTLQQ